MATHTYDLGDRVAIINTTLGGRFIVEGYAYIAEVIEDVDEQYRVRLDDGVYERFVDPAAQDDPEGYVENMNAEARATAYRNT